MVSGTMKTTLEISDELLLRAKQAALERGTTLRAIVEEALRRSLGPVVAEAPPLRTITWPDTGRRAGAATAKAVDSFVADQRDGRLDDPDYWQKRFGFVPSGLRRR